MAPSAIEFGLGSASEDRNDHDLQFLAEIKNEVPASASRASSASASTDTDPALAPVYLGMRRNSSFADYFEGDLSQNLLSRRNFPHLSDIDGASSNYTTSTSSSYRSEQDLVTSLVDKIRIESLGGKNCATSDASSERKLRKFSEIFMGHWFFTNFKQGGLGQLRRRRTVSLPCDGAEEEESQDDPQDEDSDQVQSGFSGLVSRHFSATSDIRAFNLNMPQSQ